MKELRPFTTDGCSDCGLSKLFWIFRQKLPEDMHALCVEHDKEYWKGGTARERWLADIRFRYKIADLGFPKIATVYYYAVRVGGVPWLPTPWRWGYGWVGG